MNSIMLYVLHATEVQMRKNFLKGLFKKNKFDWTSEEYIKKSLQLLKQSEKLEFYEDEAKDKKNFEERFRQLLD